MSKGSILSYSFIALILLEGPLVTIFGIRGIHYIAEAIMLVVFFVFLTNKQFKQILKNFPVVVWFFWIIYTLTNWYLFQDITPSAINNPSSLNFIVRKFLVPLFMLIITYFEGLRNLSSLLKMLLVILTIYIIIGMSFQTAASGVLSDERGGEYLGNALPLTGCVLSFIVSIALSKKVVSSRTFWVISIIAFLSILFGAARKAIGGWAIITLFLILGTLNLKDPKKIALFLILGFGGYFFFDYMMENTVMGQRLSMIEETSMAYGAENSLFLKFMGDRAFFYIYGFELFLKNPLNGIGLTNFPIYMNTEVPIHSEYIVQLCECGLIGSFLYLLFNASIIRSIIIAFKHTPYALVMVCLGGMLSVLFISFYSWTYSITRYFMMFGIILSICAPLNKYKFNNDNYR